MAATRKNLLVDLGTTFRLPVLYRDPDGNPIDLTGHTLYFRVYEPGNSNSNWAVQSIEGPANGEFTVMFSDEETASWTWRKGAYTLDVQEPDGNWYGLLWGTLTVRDRADI